MPTKSVFYGSVLWSMCDLVAEQTVDCGRYIAAAAILATVSLSGGCSSETGSAGDMVVIHGATVVDVQTGSSKQQAIVIEGGRITTLTGTIPTVPAGADVIDASGKWIVPGFVDVHVHDASDPYLRGMLAWGITSVQLMPNHPPTNPVAMEQAAEEPQTLSPRLQVTAMFTGEFPDNILPGVYEFRKPKTDAEAQEMVNVLHRNGYRQIKIIQDDSVLFAGAINASSLLDEAVFKALVSQARANEMRVYAHTTQVAETSVATEAGVDAFIHGTMDAKLDEEHWELILAANTVWAPTYHALYWFGDQKSYAARVLSDTRLIRLLPKEQIEGFKTQANSDTPIVTGAMQMLVDHTDTYVATIAENTRDAQEAGVEIAVGSDGGPAGISTHLEMELLQENGLTSIEVLRAATYGGAIAMGRQDETGSIEAGKLADLVILNADPGSDIRNSRDIEWVVKGGAIYRPAELTNID